VVLTENSDLTDMPTSHGLSYTSFKYSDLQLTSGSIQGASDFTAKASFLLTNTGPKAGSEATQLYITMPAASDLSHPPIALRAFKKVYLESGQTERVELSLDKYAVSYWDERLALWRAEKGDYTIKVGPSSQMLPLHATLTVPRTCEWNGL